MDSINKKELIDSIQRFLIPKSKNIEELEKNKVVANGYHIAYVSGMIALRGYLIATFKLPT